MLQKVRYYCKMGGHFLKMRAQAQMEYPSFLISWLIIIPLQALFGLLTIYATVSNFGSIGGWGFEEIVFMYGVATMSHGVSVVMFIQTWYIRGLILEGGFDRMMLRPLSVLFQFFTVDFNFIGFVDMVPAIGALIYGGVLVGFQPTVTNVLQLIAVILGASLIRGAIYLATGSISFFAQGGADFVGVNLKLFSYASMYPMSIYPEAIQAIFTFVIPVAFIGFYPAAEFLGKGTAFFIPQNMWAGSLLAGVIIFTLACLFFRRGLSAYESAGS